MWGLWEDKGEEAVVEQMDDAGNNDGREQSVDILVCESVHEEDERETGDNVEEHDAGEAGSTVRHIGVVIGQSDLECRKTKAEQDA